MENDNSPIEKLSVDNQEDYISFFDKYEGNKEEVLKYIHDIRKFEIDLYWKRTTFFWTIIGVILAGYFLIQSRIVANGVQSLKVSFALACLGLIFSVGWYFVNRGSKYWQVNWEKHLDVLEDKVVGPLYKTIIDREYYHRKFWMPTSPYPFSVSKVNQILNVIMIFFWIILLIDFIITNLSFLPFSIRGYFSFYFIMGLFTFIGIVSLYSFSHTGIDFKLLGWKKRWIKNTKVNFEKRGLD